MSERNDAVLQVRDLTVAFATEGDPVTPVDRIDLTIGRGETLAVVGESGSGKSTLALAVMGLLPSKGSAVTGSVTLNGADLLTKTDQERRAIRGSGIGMVFQDPGTSLNPVMRVGPQVVEALRLHSDLDRAASKQRVLDFFESVGMPQPTRTFSAFPHQLSGGMKQRVMLAVAMINQPELLVADEPTTALDVTVQAQVLAMLKRMRDAANTSVLFITHNLAVVADIADRVAVMYAGQVVEEGPTERVFAMPAHPYTKALLASVPSAERSQPIIAALPGSAVGATGRPVGCRFHPRCAFATERCSIEQPILRRSPGGPGMVACHYAESVIEAGAVRRRPSLTIEAAGAPDFPGRQHEDDGRNRLVVRDLSFTHPTRWRLRSGPASAPTVDTVSLNLVAGRTLGLVGESGSGKTTLARCLVRLANPDSGSITVDGIELVGANKRKIAKARRSIQFVFQDPFESLDPLWTVENLVREPLLQLDQNKRTQRAAVRKALEAVDLGADVLSRRPRDFSGGERQRISLARALVVRPQVLVFDEPTAALDVSVQAKIIELLQRIQREHSIAYLFITHDLALIRQVASRIAVMYQGRIVEEGEVDQVFTNPQHDYTHKLLDALPGRALATLTSRGKQSQPADQA